MKTALLVTTSCAMMVLSCADARAQDTNRVPDVDRSVCAVDSAVRADVQERLLLGLQPPDKVPKFSTTYSHWGFPAPGQPPATRFGSTQAGVPKTNTLGDDPASGDRSVSTFEAGAQSPNSAVWPARFTDPVSSALESGAHASPQ